MLLAMTQKCDVAVLGGGAAGLSGAVALGRARRSVVVVDAGSPRNAPADSVHGFLSRNGISPLELTEIGRAEVKRYGGLMLSATVVAARSTNNGFEVSLEDGQSITARRLLVTTGISDELPDVSGVRERWGRDVVHCPHCHGWELRDQPVSVLATHTEWAVRQALMFQQLASEVTFFQHTSPALTEQQVAQLTAWGIGVVTEPVDSLEVADDRITGVRMADGSVAACSAVVVAPRLVANSGVLTDLGLEPTLHRSPGSTWHRAPWTAPPRPGSTSRGSRPTSRHGIPPRRSSTWCRCSSSSCPAPPATPYTPPGRSRLAGRNASHRRPPPGRPGGADATAPAAPPPHVYGRRGRHCAGPVGVGNHHLSRRTPGHRPGWRADHAHRRGPVRGTTRSRRTAVTTNAMTTPMTRTTENRGNRS